MSSFRPSAQMVSITGRSRLLPVVGHSMAVGNVWRLTSSSLSFHLSGPLPYDQELQEPQTALLRYVLEQNYSRELVCTMLGLNKQVNVFLSFFYLSLFFSCSLSLSLSFSLYLPAVLIEYVYFDFREIAVIKLPFPNSFF